MEAFDTRPVVEEQVKSLGARFVKIDLGETGQTRDGYAKALTDEQLQKQREAMAKVCASSDIVITTAQLFGRKAPLIVSEEMIQGMQKGSVIVDLAASTGVHDGDAVIKQLLAGANAVQVASSLYRNGPEYIGEMKSTLTQWMEKHKFSKLSDFQGRMSQDRSSDPAAFERVQFMKYFK